MTETTGSKYEQVKDMDVKDIAKLIRADLKEVLADSKPSVTIERYAGGQSINVKLFSASYPDWAVQDVKREIVNSVVDQYRYSNSDSMSDYYNTNFYSHTSFGVKNG